jgi:hypothetical protein
MQRACPRAPASRVEVRIRSCAVRWSRRESLVGLHGALGLDRWRTARRCRVPPQPAASARAGPRPATTTLSLPVIPPCIAYPNAITAGLWRAIPPAGEPGLGHPCWNGSGVRPSSNSLRLSTTCVAHARCNASCWMTGPIRAQLTVRTAPTPTELTFNQPRAGRWVESKVRLVITALFVEGHPPREVAERYGVHRA